MENTEEFQPLFGINIPQTCNHLCLGSQWIFGIYIDYLKNLHADKIDLYCRWLYQPAHADGKPRVLHIVRRYVDYSPISLFIDRLKQDFLMATDPIYFFIRVILPKTFQLQENISLKNDKTKETFQTKVEKSDLKFQKDKLLLQISRHPLASTENWIVFGKEYYEKKIYLLTDLNVVAI